MLLYSAIKGMSVPEARVGRGTESLQVSVRDLKKMWPVKVVYSALFSGIVMLTFCSEACSCLLFPQLLCGLQSHKELKRSMPDCRSTGQATSVCFLAVQWFVKTWADKGSILPVRLGRKKLSSCQQILQHFCPGNPLMTFLL